ncbi:hypothetical protein N8I77_013575 [Diaporthe amygdali]|uniref:Rhodopsin domain-containing protein n=1 Tax=Phomopsis amygdali TaxID=1214568 RepID=A0AAD9VWH4_PHOAM|nr:hypothetical protein N8I77_013575 [Diaporthe amygdali]
MADSQQVGVIPAPAGETAHFGDGHTSLQTTLIVINLVTFAFATVFLCLRLYTSAFIIKRPDLGDFFIVASWGVGAGSIACTIIAIQYGFGKHAWNVKPTEILGYYHKLVAMAVTYFWTPSLTKLSVLTLIHHVYRAKWGRVCTWVIAAAILIYTIVFTVLVTGPCNPMGGSVKCLNNVGGAHAALNILSDVLVIVLPIPLVHELQMPMRQKISVGILMTLGSFCLIASIGRIAFVVDIHDNPDITFCEAKVGVWSALELNIGIMGASLARLKPFVQRYFPKLSTSGAGSYGPKIKGPSGYGNSERSDRPTRDEYLLHSVQKSSMVPPEGYIQGKHNGISVQSDVYVSRSNMGPHGTGAENVWTYTPQVQSVGNEYRS